MTKLSTIAALAALTLVACAAPDSSDDENVSTATAPVMGERPVGRTVAAFASPVPTLELPATKPTAEHPCFRTYSCSSERVREKMLRLDDDHCTFDGDDLYLPEWAMQSAFGNVDSVEGDASHFIVRLQSPAPGADSTFVCTNVID